MPRRSGRRRRVSIEGVGCMGLWGGIVDGVPDGVGSRYRGIGESVGMKTKYGGYARDVNDTSIFSLCLNATVINMM
jgi:hypothetical protein